MVVFSVQAKLPSRQYVRLVGSLEKLGKWSPYDSLELQPSPGDCSVGKTWSVNVDITTEGNVSFRFLICEKVIGSGQGAFSIIKCGPCQSLPVLDEINSGELDINDPAWCDGWLLYDTEIHLTVHNSNGFPFELFEKNCLPDPETKKYTIKVTAMDIDKVWSATNKQSFAKGEVTIGEYSPIIIEPEEYGSFSCRNASDVNVKIVGECNCTVESQGESGVEYDPSKHYSFIIRVLDSKTTVFKFEVCVADGSSEGAVETIGHGFIQPIHFKRSCGTIDVGLVRKEFPTGSLQVEYLVIKPLADKYLHNVEDWADRNWQNADRTLNMGHRGCGSTFGSGREGVQENTIESFMMAYEKGADGLELDVHVPKDLQPVIYHDLYLNVPLQTKKLKDLDFHVNQRQRWRFF